jgi:hypothetical protein
MEQCCCVLGCRVQRREELQGVIAEVPLSVEPIPRVALFLAGKVFLGRGGGLTRALRTQLLQVTKLPGAWVTRPARFTISLLGHTT